MDDEFVFLSSSGCFDGGSSGSGPSSGGNGGCGLMLLGMVVVALVLWVVSMLVNGICIKCTEPDTRWVDSTELGSDKMLPTPDTIGVQPRVDPRVKPEPRPESVKVSTGSSHSYCVDDEDEYDDEDDDEEYDDEEQEDREYDDYDDDEVW